MLGYSQALPDYSDEVYQEKEAKKSVVISCKDLIGPPQGDIHASDSFKSIHSNLNPELRPAEVAKCGFNTHSPVFVPTSKVQVLKS